MAAFLKLCVFFLQSFTKDLTCAVLPASTVVSVTVTCDVAITGAT